MKCLQSGSTYLVHYQQSEHQFVGKLLYQIPDKILTPTLLQPKFMNKFADRYPVGLIFPNCALRHGDFIQLISTSYINLLGHLNFRTCSSFYYFSLCSFPDLV